MVNRASEIYPFKRNIERTLKLVSQDPHNAECLMKYYRSRVAEGISDARICKCMSTLKRISRMLDRPFSNATKDDFVRLVSELERSDLSEWSKRDYKVVLKHFYKWLRNWEDGSPPEVRWMRKLGHVENKRPILPKDLLTEEEKLRMLRATMNPRDRALLEALFESGRRPEEILTLHIGDVEFDDVGAKLHVNGKMGEDFARVISAAPALAVWIDNHPLRENSDAPVWVGLGRSNMMRQITYDAARSLVKKIAKRAGVSKRIIFYLFRHTRIDETQGILTEAQQCMMFGWKFGSRMPGVYFKRSGKHIDNAQAIMNGIAPKQKQVSPALAAKKCARCRSDSSPASKFCNRCGNVLDIETAVKLDEARTLFEKVIQQFVDDPAKMRKVARLLK